MQNKLEQFGTIFRFLTPILIGIVGWISIQFLSSIDARFNRIDIKFDTFLTSYHIMDKRLDKLEFRIYGN